MSEHELNEINAKSNDATHTPLPTDTASFGSINKWTNDRMMYQTQKLDKSRNGCGISYDSMQLIFSVPILNHIWNCVRNERFYWRGNVHFHTELTWYLEAVRFFLCMCDCDVDKFSRNIKKKQKKKQMCKSIKFNLTNIDFSLFVYNSFTIYFYFYFWRYHFFINHHIFIDFDILKCFFFFNFKYKIHTSHWLTWLQNHVHT